MATNVSDLLDEIRHVISDKPLKVEDRIYTDRQLADFFPVAISDHNTQALQTMAYSGVGPVNMTVTPTLAAGSEARRLLVLFVAKAVYEFEMNEARRVGFRISNVAGTVDGRGRYTSAREGVRDVITLINKILGRQADRSAVPAGTYRSMARKADPNNVESET